MKKKIFLLSSIFFILSFISLNSIGCFFDHNNGITELKQGESPKSLINNREISSKDIINNNFGEFSLEITQGSCEDGYISVSQTPINDSSSKIELKKLISQPSKPIFGNYRANITNLTNDYDEVSNYFYSIELINKNKKPMLLANPATLIFNHNNDYPLHSYYAAKRKNNKWYLQAPNQYNKTFLSFQTYSFSDWLLVKGKNISPIEKSPVITAPTSLATNGKNGNFKNNLDIKITAPYHSAGKYSLKIFGRVNFPIIYDSKTLTATNSYEINLSSLPQPDISSNLATYSLTLEFKEYGLDDVPDFIILVAEYTDPETNYCYISQKRVSFIEGIEDSEQIEEPVAPYVIKTEPQNQVNTPIIETNSKIIIEFSQEMDTSSIDSALTINPKVKGKIVKKWSNNNKILTLSCQFEDFQTYTLTINKTAKSDYLSLENDFVLIFGTPKPSGTETNTGSSTSTNTSSGTGTNTVTDTGSGTETNTSSSTSTNTNSGTGTNTNTATDTGSGTETNTGSSTDTNTNSGTGTNTNTGTGSETGTNTDTNTEKPGIISVSPESYSENIYPNQIITINFSKVMNQTSVINSISISPTLSQGFSTNWINGKTLNITANKGWQPNTSYIINISKNAQDNENQQLKEEFSLRFKTILSPIVLSINPTNQATEIALDKSIEITFSKPMNENVTEGAIEVNPSSNLSFRWENSSQKLIITNSENWAEYTYIRTIIKESVIDSESIAIANPQNSSFRTILIPKVVLNNCQPKSGSNSVATDSEIIVVFNKAVNKNSAEQAFSLKKSNSNVSIEGYFRWDGNKMIFKPLASLAYGTQYNVEITDDYYDANGTHPTGNSSWSFKTEVNEGNNWNNLFAQNENDTTVIPRTDHSMIVFNNALWIIGGKDNTGSPLGDICKSTNGETWTKITSNADFGARFGHSCTVFNNKIWVSGGIKIDDISGVTYLNDVWNSSDGINWIKVSNDRETSNYVNETLFSRRAYHNMISYNGKLWVMLGESPDGLVGDIWSSSDGITWDDRSKIDIPRKKASVLVFKDVEDNNYESIFVLGGYGKDSNNNEIALNELVLFKDKNTNWSKKSDNIGITPFYGAGATVYNDRIWLISGQTGSVGNPSYLSKIYATNNGSNWIQMPYNNNFKARSNHQVITFDSKIVISGGENSDSTFNEIWSVK